MLHIDATAMSILAMGIAERLGLDGPASIPETTGVATAVPALSQNRAMPSAIGIAASTVRHLTSSIRPS